MDFHGEVKDEAANALLGHHVCLLEVGPQRDPRHVVSRQADLSRPSCLFNTLNPTTARDIQGSSRC